MRGGFDSEPWCKNCFHGYSGHIESRSLLEKYIVWKLLLGTAQGCVTGSRCECKQFVATDNLRLVEWLAKEKKLV